MLMDMIAMTCRACGVTFSVEGYRDTYCCPSCGSNDLSLVESKAQRKIRNLTRPILWIVFPIVILTAVFVSAFKMAALNHARKGEIHPPVAYGMCLGVDYRVIQSEFEDAGFTNVQFITYSDDDDNPLVTRISIAGSSDFKKNEWFPSDAVVRITYGTYSSPTPTPEPTPVPTPTPSPTPTPTPTLEPYGPAYVSPQPTESAEDDSSSGFFSFITDIFH